jgi:TolA-binding protein
MAGMFRNTLILFVFLLAATLSVAQSDSTKKTSDSLNTALLGDFQKKISRIEEQRITDSIQKADLEKQLSSLKTTDNLKKEELQKQLQELNDKDARRLAEKKRSIDSLRLTAKSYPVLGFFKDTLFSIYSKLGSFSASDRAAAIETRIHKLADNFRFRRDSLRTEESETTVDVVFGETIIISVSENDAIWNNSTKAALTNSTAKLLVTQ